jgi:hypothetical protein
MSVTEKKADKSDLEEKLEEKPELEKKKADIKKFVKNSNFSHILNIGAKNEIYTHYNHIIEQNRDKHANPIKEQIYNKVNGILRIHTANYILNSLNELSDLKKADLLDIYNTIKNGLTFNKGLIIEKKKITIEKAKKNELDDILKDYKEEFDKKWQSVNLTDPDEIKNLVNNETILYTNEEFYKDTDKHYGHTVSVFKIPMKKIGHTVNIVDTAIGKKNRQYIGPDYRIYYFDENDENKVPQQFDITKTQELPNKSESYNKTLKIYKENKDNQSGDTSGGKRRKTRRRNRKSKKTRKSRNNRRKSKRKSLR